PAGVRLVVRPTGELHPSAHQGVAPRGVDDPAGPEGEVLVAARQGDLVQGVAFGEGDLTDGGPLEEDRAVVFDHATEVALEAAPVELVGGNDGLLGGADLRALLE